MREKITAFLPYMGYAYTEETITQLKKNEAIKNVYLLASSDFKESVKGTEKIRVQNLFGSDSIRLISEKTDTEYALIFTQDNLYDFGLLSLERFLNVAEDSGAGLVYSDYYEIKGDSRNQHPVIDYQEGSLRDDFNFGFALLYSSEALKKAVSETNEKYENAGLYDLRLKVSRSYPILRIPEYLYSTIETDERKTGEKQFDYVNPKNRAVQIEMENACTSHLKATGAYLEPKFKEISLKEGDFEFEASVVIPVRNRIRTIADAIESVLSQKADFKFNLFVVDNYSTDGTTEKVAEYAAKDPRIVHLIPERKDLGIGGCWNTAVHNSKCGRFAIQLDSDDLYKDENTVQKIVDRFHEEKCAMVIGSYTMTDVNLQILPPGLIDHKEWTPENGRNNALRINGLGAPRAFYTPMLRKINLPNTSYGEDYALGLAISRDYQIGRIYESLYLCRRWEGNSDAALDVIKDNANNLYKDRIRTFEFLARKRKNSGK